MTSEPEIGVVLVGMAARPDVVAPLVGALPPGFELVYVGDVDELRLGVWGERVDRIVDEAAGGLLSALGSRPATVSMVVGGPVDQSMILETLDRSRRGQVHHDNNLVAGPTGVLLAAAARCDGSVAGLIEALGKSGGSRSPVDDGADGREPVVVVADRAPTFGLDAESGRVCDILMRLNSVPSVVVTLLLTGDDRANAAMWEDMGIRVTGPHPDPPHIAAAMGSAAGLVVLCGAGGALRVLNTRNPTLAAAIVVDANALATVRRPEVPPNRLAQEERAGAATLQAQRLRRDRSLLERADQVWCRSEAEAERVRSLGAAAKVRIVPPLWTFGASERPRTSGPTVGILTGAHSEYAEIDIETTIEFIGSWPEIRSVHPDAVLLVELDREFRFDCLDGAEGIRTVAFGDGDPDLWVLPRAFGGTDWAALSRAVSTGVPILASSEAVGDLDDPAAAGIMVVEASTIVHETIKCLGVDLPFEQSRLVVSDDFEEAMSELGHVVSEQDRPPLPKLGKQRGRDLKQQRYLRGRIDTPTPEDEPAAPRRPLSDHRPLISLLVPVYDPPLPALASCIDSVMQQSYEQWELCLVDDAGLDPAVREMLRDYEERDTRIRVYEREENGGISAASATALAMAKGEFVALLDHDDTLEATALEEVARLLEQHPETDFMYSDEDKLTVDGDVYSPYLKPGWSPDLHLGYNYVCHFAVYRRSVVLDAGGFRSGFDGAQDYDLSLRVTELTDRVVHLPRRLYHWRAIPGSTATGIEAKDYAWMAGKLALEHAVQRRGLVADVVEGINPGTYRLRYAVVGQPKVSIIIPTRDRVEMMRACTERINEISTYRNYEILVVDNESEDAETVAWLEAHDGPVISYPHQFSYARMMNLAAEAADADLLLFLNNDTLVETADWLEAMIQMAQQPRVGAVGARLMFPDGRAQHEGIAVGVGGVAGNVAASHYFSLGCQVRNCWALTAACLMMRPEVLWEVGGFEDRLRVAFNDVDLTMRVHEAGYDVVYTPYSLLTHAESASRGALHPQEDEDFFANRWGPWALSDDPYYNPGLSRRVPYVPAEEVKPVWVHVGPAET